jgi:hypothetical protein
MAAESAKLPPVQDHPDERVRQQQKDRAAGGKDRLASDVDDAHAHGLRFRVSEDGMSADVHSVSSVTTASVRWWDRRHIINNVPTRRQPLGRKMA